MVNWKHPLSFQPQLFQSVSQRGESSRVGCFSTRLPMHLLGVLCRAVLVLTPCLEGGSSVNESCESHLSPLKFLPWKMRGSEARFKGADMLLQ